MTSDRPSLQQDARPGAEGRPPEERERSYRRLPGRMSTLWPGSYGFRSLYLGDDHLLQVERVLFTDSYKRFAYADIRSLLVRKTVHGSVFNIALGLAAAVAGLLSLEPQGGVARGLWWALAGICASLVTVNLLRGPTCRCQLETAVGQQALRSLNRLRTTRRALGLLAEQIVAVQGAIPSDEAARRVNEAWRKDGPRGATASDPKPEAQTPEERW